MYIYQIYIFKLKATAVTVEAELSEIGGIYCIYSYCILYTVYIIHLHIYCTHFLVHPNGWSL